MKLSVPLVFGTVFILLVSGCLSVTPEDIVKSTPAVGQFMEEHPNAEVMATRYTQSEFGEIEDEIKEDCKKASISAKDYYKVTITDEESGVSMTAWVDWNGHATECVVKETREPGGGDTDCVSHSEARCYGGNAYWYDSCGNKEEQKEYCEYGCENGMCKLEGLSVVENRKDMSKYSGKQVFLVSDKNWKDILQLVPLTTWTGNENCNRGYGTAGNICVYPTLIYHEEGPINSVNFDENDFGLLDLFDGISADISLNSTSLSKGETLSVTVYVKNNLDYPFQPRLFLDKYPPALKPLGNLDVGLSLEPSEVKQHQFSFIFEGEGSSFDADSIVWFMQQYGAEDVKYLGEMPKELENLLASEADSGAGIDSIDEISFDDYLSYWDFYDKIMYSQDNYELALMASTYASLINAPLVIKGTSLDKNANFNGREVICVGNVDKSCNEKYSLEELQKKYVEETNTDRIILVNPNDSDIKVEDEFQPEKSGNPIHEIYSKTSLASPILASAKHELIISTTATDYGSVDRFIEDEIGRLYDSRYDAGYLTILASPNAIEMSKETNLDHGERKRREEVDNHIYGNLDGDSFQELAVGRIFSLTSSDVSSYISRDLFYSWVLKGDPFSVMAVSDIGYLDMKIEGTAVENIFESLGMVSESFISDSFDSGSFPGASFFEGKPILVALAHGQFYGTEYDLDTYSLRDEKVWLDSPMVFMKACSTCAFELAETRVLSNGQRVGGKGDLFCANLIRRGAIFQYNAPVEASVSYDSPKRIVEESISNENIGAASKELKNKIIAETNLYSDSVLFIPGSFEILLGDPLFSPEFNKPGLDEVTVSSYFTDESDYVLDINVPGRQKGVTVHGERRLEDLLGESVARSDDSSAFFSFSLAIPEGYRIAGVDKVEYANDTGNFEIVSLPLNHSSVPCYDGDVSSHSYLKYIRDEGAGNKYYFVMDIPYYCASAVDPSFQIPEIIPTHEFKIHLELEKD